MSMLYIWWAVIVFVAGVLLVTVSLPIAAGQYRLHAFNRLVQFISISTITVMFLQLYHPLIALLTSVGLVVIILFAAHTRPIRRMTISLLRPYTPQIIQFVSRVTIFEYISDTRDLSDKVGVSSYEELLAIIHGSMFISESHRRNIAAYIPMLDTKVSDFMRPIDGIVAIQEDDVIGPLLLHELHLSGQHSFLVLDRSRAIKGTIKLTQLTESSKDVTKVQDIMDRHLVQIGSGTSIQEAFHTLVHEQVWLGVVSDSHKPSVITIQDISDALLGKKRC